VKVVTWHVAASARAKSLLNHYSLNAHADNREEQAHNKDYVATWHVTASKYAATV
jgi:hypothetical protein